MLDNTTTPIWTKSPSVPATRTALSIRMQEPGDNINAIAKAKGVKPHDLTALVLDRPRHGKLILPGSALPAPR